MPESPSGGVTYRHGVASVLLFSRGMWVPLWVTGVGSVLPVGQKIGCERSVGESGWPMWRLRVI